MGCSEKCSTDAASWSTSDSPKGSPAIKSVIRGRPSVSVPVLSRATTSASCSVWSASPRRKSTPISAALPVPTMMDVGVASPMAQGQAMISTDTAATNARVNAG